MQFYLLPNPQNAAVWTLASAQCEHKSTYKEVTAHELSLLFGYAYTVYVAKQNPVKGFGETNIIRDHELTTADIVELQQSLGKNLIVNNHLQAVRPNIWSPPQPPQADVVLTSVTLLLTMRE